MVYSLTAGSLIETIAIGLMATIFSTVFTIPVSFLAAHHIMTRISGGSVIYYIVRGILNVVRVVDPVVWGLIVIVWVGLGTFAGVIALTIHSIAALGKLLSEEIEHIDEGPVEALTASGANLIQTIRYAVIPQVILSFLPIHCCGGILICARRQSLDLLLGEVSAFRRRNDQARRISAVCNRIMGGCGSDHPG